MHRMKKLLFVPVALLLAVFLTAASCGDSASQQEETHTQQNSYDRLVAAQPATAMDYSPTRDTIKFWVKTWNDPNQLAYVYLQNANGDMIGFYVLKHPPVSMCTALTPNYRIYDSSNGSLALPAPGIDGVYYSGGECNTYYGEDATTGSYIEFTLGMAVNMLLYTQPLTNHPNVEKLSPAGK